MSTDESVPGTGDRRPPAARSTSSATRTSRSRPRSTGSSPTRSTPAGCCPAPACRPSASSVPRCASTPTRSGRSIGAWPTPATSRAATAPGPTSPTGRRSAAARRRWPASSPRCCAGRPSRVHRRRGGRGDVRRRHRAQAARARSSGSCSPSARTPTPATTPSGSSTRSPGMIEAEGALLDDLPERLDRFHYDLVATTTFHADEAQALRRRPGPGRGDARRARATSSSSTRSPALPAGLAGRPRLRLASAASDNIARDARRSRGRRGVEIVSALIGDADDLELVDRTADLILMSREALARARPARSRARSAIRPWTYEFDPSGLELLRRAIEHVAAEPAARRPPRLTRRDRGARAMRRPMPMLRRCATSTSGATARERYALEPAADRRPRRPRRRPTLAGDPPAGRPDERRPAGRARPAIAGRRDRRRSGSSTRSATCSSPATRRTAGRARWPRPLGDLEDAPRARTPTACSTGSATEFPGARPGAGAARPTGSRSCS